MSTLCWCRSDGLRAGLIWSVLLVALGVPLVLAATSPLLQWRQPIYIAGAFAGVVGLALMLVQPLLMAGVMPGVSGRVWHRWLGAALVVAVVAHVAGLWITSPPDVIDVLLFRSPTPFGVWGAVAMWAVFVAGGLAIVRRRLRPTVWRMLHTVAISTAVVATVAHAWLIEGTMEPVSKAVLSTLVLGTTVWLVVKRRAWMGLARRG